MATEKNRAEVRLGKVAVPEETKDKGSDPEKPGPHAREAMRKVDVGIDHVEGMACNAGADTGDRCEME